MNGLDVNRTIYYGEVIDVNDPLNLGRVRCVPKDWQVQSYNIALPVGELDNINDKWTLKDPFLVYPLLPIFLYQVPKEKEFVHIIFYDKKYPENNRFYIQGNFSSIDNLDNDTFNSMVNGLALGERNKPTQGKIIPQTSIPTKPNNQGLYPVPSTVSLLGRNNSDVMLPKNGFIARVNKEFRTNEGVTFNKRNSFTMLQHYENRKTDSTVETSTTTISVYQNLNYLIEYNVYGGLGTEDGNFSGYIELYSISPFNSINTSAFTESKYFEVSDDSKIGPIFRKDYLNESFKTITDGIKELIINLNNGKIGLKDNIVSSTLKQFPFVFQPSKQLYDNSINSTGIKNFNANKFIRNVFLNETDTTRGYGLVSEKNTLGPLKEAREITTLRPDINNTSTAVGMTASDFIFLLSHETQIPNLLKIDFQDAPPYSENTLDQKFIWDNIYPNTNSMVRGEKLLNLLELIVKYLLNHVHPYHNMPPNPVAKDQTTSQQILTEIFNGYQNILNEKLRIN
jgi:hypothetical protein